ncbi:TlpA family protein disulfide reductase [Melittangium boletus]|uniref:Thiol:disulfide interchange protein n=1 Tax=Melittangium boletus DSM 14713 TaxID=1294270 RepID=A0A250I8I8_9BACT|nr:TlpA disulfide reductase family protein [Melittangium boletus]ATB27481.1 thiol:disulfide interchange protein [Melittangium boletus DSM 14713]
MKTPGQMGARVKHLWRQARHRWWSRLGLDLLLFALVFGAVATWQTRRLPVGAPAPDFTLRTLSGDTVRLAELRGQPVVLAFWAPWCGVCKAESSTLSQLQGTVGGSARVLSVAVAYDDEADVRRFVREHDVDYPVLLGGGALTRAYAVEQFPTTFFVSAEGRIERAVIGYTTLPGMLWRLWW